MNNQIELTLLRLSNKLAELEERVAYLEKKSQRKGVSENKTIEKNSSNDLRNPCVITCNSDIENAMHTLAIQGIIDKKDISELSDKYWCSRNLKLAFPLLREKIKGRLDTSGHPRYWKGAVMIKGKEYYVCSQWYAYNIKYFENWLNNKLMSYH